MEKITVQQLVRKYEGVTELPPNKGFKQTWFQKQMQKIGWYIGAPWCSFAVKVFWTELHGEQQAKGISGSALKTYLKFEQFKNAKPEVGGLVVWRMYKKGKPTSMGHIGLVVDVDGDFTYDSLEGNTSAKLERDGQGIFLKTHTIKWESTSRLKESKKTGLVLLGFIDAPKTV